MKVLVAADAHIFELPDGTYWCKSVYSYDFWKRYLTVFDEVKVVSRVKKVEKLEGKFLRADGPHVDIFGIPFYQGPKQLLKKYFQIQKTLKNAYEGCACAIFRMPSQTAEMTLRFKPHEMPFVGEVVYCPMDDLKRDKLGIIKALDFITSERLKKFCMRANGVSYVTKSSIQNSYPSYAKIHGADSEHFETYYSSISLSEDAFSSPRNEFGSPLRIVLTDDAMNSERKGEVIAIKALKRIINSERKAELILIGDGTKKGDFENLAREMNVNQYITFTGRLSSAEEVAAYLRKSDMYILPTTGEGLPRGIIEAMALGMPVLSTPVGGIPEIIDNKYLFSPYDDKGFADTICRLIDNPEEMKKMSQQNYRKALEFKNEILQQRRNDFYLSLKELAGVIR